MLSHAACAHGDATGHDEVGEGVELVELRFLGGEVNVACYARKVCHVCRKGAVGHSGTPDPGGEGGAGILERQYGEGGDLWHANLSAKISTDAAHVGAGE